MLSPLLTSQCFAHDLVMSAQFVIGSVHASMTCLLYVCTSYLCHLLIYLCIDAENQIRKKVSIVTSILVTIHDIYNYTHETATCMIRSLKLLVV